MLALRLMFSVRYIYTRSHLSQTCTCTGLTTIIGTPAHVGSYSIAREATNSYYIGYALHILDVKSTHGQPRNFCYMVAMQNQY